MVSLALLCLQYCTHDKVKMRKDKARFSSQPGQRGATVNMFYIFNLLFLLVPSGNLANVGKMFIDMHTELPRR